jgi:AraC-like DNA-binding protein
MDLALAMIEADLGRKVALAIARRHVVFRIRPGGQSEFSAELAAQSGGNARVQKLAEMVTAHPRRLADRGMAAEVRVSQRSLSRLFRTGLNISPADFVERVRIDLARRRLLDTDEHVETIEAASLSTPRVPDGVIAHPSAPQFSSNHAVIRAYRWPKPQGGTAILMRTGKRRSAIVMISRGFPGIRRSSSSVLINDDTATGRCPVLLTSQVLRTPRPEQG